MCVAGTGAPLLLGDIFQIIEKILQCKVGMTLERITERN